MSTYSQLLKDPRWQKVRLKKLEAAEWKCQRCWDGEQMLSVHHKRYVKGRMPWEYPDHELVVLCQPCHEIEHGEKDARSELLAALHVDGPAGAGDFFGVGAGYVCVQTSDEVLNEIARQFEEEYPYQFTCGMFLAALQSDPIYRDGFAFMTEELLGITERGFREEFLSLLRKHGVLRERPQG